MTNPKQEWDGFADPHWNLGQVILWIATGDRDYVDKASDRGGSPGESYWLAPAAVLINEQIPSADVRRKLVEQIRQEADANVCNKADANFRKRIAELIGQICQEPDPSERQKLAEQMCQEAEANARQKLVEQAFAGVRKEIAEQI